MSTGEYAGNGSRSIADIEGIRPKVETENLVKKILIADQDIMFSDALSTIIGQRTDLMPVSGWRGDNLYRLIKGRSLDVLVYDPLVYYGGVSSVAKVRSWCPGAKIIALSSTMDESKIFGLIRAGVRSFVSKVSSVDKLLLAIKAQLSDEAYLSNDISTMILEELSKIEFKVDGQSLTPRQFEIVSLIVQGKSNKEIAQNFALTEKTIKNYVSDILVKMDATNRTNLAIKVVQNGFPISTEEKEKVYLA